MTDDIREAARQAAREAVAKRYNNDAKWASRVAKIRSGEVDDEVFIHGVLLGADAALAAVAPLIRAQCAAASDPALTAAVVEMRDALAEFTNRFASNRQGDPDWTLSDREFYDRCVALIARVEVSR